MSVISIYVRSPFCKNKSPWNYPRALLPAIVHDYFLNRGVPGSADMIPSACEPVLLPTSILHNFRKKSTGELYKKFSRNNYFSGNADFWMKEWYIYK